MTGHEQAIGEVYFYPLTGKERALATDRGLAPRHKNYHCGACGMTTNGRVVCDLVRKSDNAIVSWCMCSCNRAEPTIIVAEGGDIIMQLPMAREFRPGPDWPAELAALYEEAAKAYSAGAFTAASMVCRKLLMSCACDKGAADGGAFSGYVDHIVGQVLTYPEAKQPIDKIRTIGNDANHHVAIVNQSDAHTAMKIVTYLLNTIYSLPAA